MDLRAAYEFRAPTADELEAAADVLVADELEESGQIVLGADFLREQWSRTDFDLATDAWVAADGGGAVVAYGQAMREGPNLVQSWGVVHPAHRGRGLGSSLLDRIEERTAQLLAGVPAGRFRHAVNAGDRAAAAMLRARDLRPVHHFWHMGIDLGGPVEAGPAPEGIEIRGVERSEDLSAVHAVLGAAFAEDPGYHPEPFERWAEEHTGSPSHDPMLWLLATDAGTPVGAITASAGDDRGWVDEVGVLAPSRGRGIAAALLRRSFAAFACRGIRHVMLNVDAENATGATAVYERVGMRVLNRWDQWERSEEAFH